jgi:hypothetical protein
MKLETEKTVITTPWFPVWYTLCPRKGITQVIGDVVLREKLPPPM